ncbi:MAG: hypothetical protein IKC01_05240 [Clostridia bacterium]|nr:hypothetical protein [Clostridia bacterium]
MKSIVKKIALLLTVSAFIVVSVIPMVAFEVKRYYGDIDNDGDVTVYDARSILRAVIGISDENYSEDDFAAADIDLNEKLTTIDARIALRIAAQLEAKVYMPEYEFKKHEKELVQLINDYRKTETDGALANLILSEELSSVADQAAMEFAVQSGTALRRSNGSYYNTLLDDYDIHYNMIDKVMCISTTSYAQGFAKLMKESQSCKALKSANFKEIGIGAFSKDGHTVYWCILLVG